MGSQSRNLRRNSPTRGLGETGKKIMGSCLLAFALLQPHVVGAQAIHGFVEALNGVRTASGSGFESGSYTSQESRLQLKVNGFQDDASYFARMDFFYDALRQEDVDFELREAFFEYSGFSFADLKVGRQIITWGTGDLLFINDVFPKDWQSFFMGREDQYLKAPSDAIRVGYYNRFMNLNVVGLPGFDPDRLPTADRLAFYNPFPSGNRPIEPENKIQNGELALRAYRSIGSMELALYGYVGYFRQPVGFDGRVQAPVYSHLRVYGASVRRSVLNGVANAEMGYYDSRDDRNGNDPFVENSSLRWMLGYDRQLWSDFQVGIQGYYEHMQDYDEYRAGMVSDSFVRDELRQLYTLRITQMLKYQTLKLSMFTFASPTDEDVYMRMLASYKLSDPLEVVVGANVFGGTHKETLFGQLDDNDNFHIRARYSF